MDAMGDRQQSFFSQSDWKPKPQHFQRGKFPKGRPVKHSDEIVYSKGTSVQTMPSLSKQLEGLSTCVIGLQYVWEYRSPSMSVAPLYHCKVCNVHQVQCHMLAHVAGWKHSIRYIKKDHPDKITFTEEEVAKDPTLKKTLKEVAAELESTEGKGQLKVILKEPSDVPAFKGLISTPQKRPFEKPAHFGPKPSRGGYQSDGFGGYASLHAPPDYSLDHGNFYGMGHDPHMRHKPQRNEYEAYEHGQPTDYHEYREAPMLEQPHRHDSGDISGTLLGYLDTFKIENESDAQLVLKVTQKLTDILMEYRLGRVPLDPPGFPTPPPPKMPRFNEQYSGYQGPSRYSGASARF